MEAASRHQCIKDLPQIVQLSHCGIETEEENGDPELPKNCGPLYQRGGMLTKREKERDKRRAGVGGGVGGEELDHAWMTATLHL